MILDALLSSGIVRAEQLHDLDLDGLTLLARKAVNSALEHFDADEILCEIRGRAPSKGHQRIAA